MTLFESVFAGNDAVYGLTEGAINQAIEKYGADKAVDVYKRQAGDSPSYIFFVFIYGGCINQTVS